MGRSRSIGALLALLALLALAGAVRTAAADGEKPSLDRALWLEKTVRDPSAALQAFQAARAAAKEDPQVRSDAALGEARCLLALGRDADAAETWKQVLADPTAPTAAKEEAHARLDEREKARIAAATQAAATRDEEARRREETARTEHEARLRAASRLVDSAAEHLRAKRYELARDDLIKALASNPDDARAAALLDEVGGYLADRGDLLRQAIRFVASSRLADYRRLASEVERLREAGRRALKEGRVAEAVDSLRGAIARVDESDFYAELSGARQEAALWLEKALADPRLGSKPPAGTDPPARPADPPSSVRAWRSEFFALLGRLFASRAEGQAPLRFFDASIPPNPDRRPGSAEGSFAARGVSASKDAGTLRRARWLEHVVRAEVAPGSWTGPDRLLERYDDLVLVQHTPQVLRQVEGLLAAFPATPPPPTVAEVRVLAAKPGGAADVVRLLGLSAGPTEPGVASIARGRRLDEILDAIRSDTDRVDVIAQVTARLEGRHALLLHLREPSSACPLYADHDAPPIVIADRDATYGLDLDLYAEDLAGRGDEEAISVVATVRRPDRARIVPRSTGAVRIPVFLSTSTEADKRVPRSGALVLLGLPNPFRATGAAGDASGGEWPDLVVLVAARPAEGGAAAAPDVPPAPAPGAPPPLSTSDVTREYDLGALGDEVADEPPPEDWPMVSSTAPRPDAARASRDAWLAGRLTHAAELGAGAVTVHEGRVVATVPAVQQGRVASEIARLLRDEARTFALEVKATELPTEEADAIFAQVRVSPSPAEEPERLHWVLDGPATARLEERIRAVADPRGIFTLDSRIAARHTQLVTARSIRSRSIVEDFRIVHRPDGSLRTLPVNGTVEEGVVVAIRPVADVGGFVIVEVGATVARVTRVETWRPPGAPGESPPVTLPEHRVEPAWVQDNLMPTETTVLRVKSPGTEGARVVLIRVRRLGS